MKWSQGIQRIFIFLMMTLTICHSTIPLLATTSISHLSEQPLVKGKLTNGLQFFFIQSAQPKKGLLLKANIKFSEQSDANIPLLAQQASFYGTKEFHRESLIEKLNDLKLDIEGKSFQCLVNEKEISLQVCLSDFQKEKSALLLQIINQMIFQPILGEDEIEMARQHVLEDLIAQGKEPMSLKSITAQQVREFHQKCICPEKIELILMGQLDGEEMTQLIAQIFDSSVESQDAFPLLNSIESNQEESEKGILACFAHRIDLAADNQSWVVDGKIWMNEPSWANKSSNGKALGAILTVVGIGGMILAFPIVAPIAVIGGTLTTMTGVYFLASDYFKDPAYIESIRQKDLKMGFAYAYQKAHAGITLTPFERRALFIQEIVNTSHMLPKSPILLLADVYQLNEPVIAELFNSEEFTILSQIKGDFIQQRNQYKILKSSLEQELTSLISPYKDIRDLALYQARSNYSQNHYVIMEGNLNAAWDLKLDEIEKAYENRLISLTERDNLIAQTDVYYENCLADPYLKEGVDSAKAILNGLEISINYAYDYQVDQCKQTIQYEVRMERLKKGKESLIHYYDQELIEALSRFPIYVKDLPDYLDLRVL